MCNMNNNSYQEKSRETRDGRALVEAQALQLGIAKFHNKDNKLRLGTQFQMANLLCRPPS